jgi:hypothetical protein
MLYTGYIEGYYGKLLTWEERKQIIRSMQKVGLNTYIYAPKEDPWHRIRWRELYPQEWVKKLQEFVSYAKRKQVQVVLCIAPGLSYNYSSEKDYQTLLKKIHTLEEMGASHIAVLMDDVSLELPKESRGLYDSLAEAQGMLMTRLMKEVTKTLWFCPTVYATELEIHSRENGPSQKGYLDALAERLPRSIPLFWTGDEVISKKITSTCLHKVHRLFPNQLVIWDNYYANDYCPRRLFLDGLYGRSFESLKRKTQGFFLNPTGLPYTDCLYITTMGKQLQGKTSRTAWKETLVECDLPKEFEVVQPFFEGPFDRSPEEWSKTKEKKYLERGYLEKVQKALTWLNFTWKSPYQVEWYSFLHGLNSDIERWKQGEKAKEDMRLKRRFPPLLQRMFLS